MLEGGEWAADEELLGQRCELIAAAQFASPVVVGFIKAV